MYQYKLEGFPRKSKYHQTITITKDKNQRTTITKESNSLNLYCEKFDKSHEENLTIGDVRYCSGTTEALELFLSKNSSIFSFSAVLSPILLSIPPTDSDVVQTVRFNVQMIIMGRT